MAAATSGSANNLNTRKGRTKMVLPLRYHLVMANEQHPKINLPSNHVWSLLAGSSTIAFGLLHVYWAAGGRIGVEEEAEDILDRPWFLAYDILSAIVFLAVGCFALSLVLYSHSQSTRNRILQCCW